MQQILDRPEFQSAVLPFVAALACYLGLRRFSSGAWPWALAAAFALVACLINGFSVTPLTGTRKIILLVLAASIAAALLPGLLQQARVQRALSALFGVAALLWVFGAVVARMQPMSIALFACGSAALLAWLLWSFDRLVDNPARLHGAAFTLLLGVGLAAVAGASALLGQLALGLSAAVGGLFLGWVLTGSSPKTLQGGAALAALPYALAPTLFGLAAATFARLPWYALPALAAIPLAAALVPSRSDSRFLNALFSSLPGLVIALGVAFWVWQSGSSDSGY
jgi:hypothetical protein